MSTRTLRRRTHIIPSTPSKIPINIDAVNKGRKKEEDKSSSSSDENLSQLDIILGHLYDNKDLSIRSLTGEIKSKYNQAVSYLTILHDSPKYSYVSEMIGNRFGGKVDYTPGTIGSYFGGCYVKGNELKDISPGCTPSCLGSIPPGDKTQGFNLCENQVLNMTWIGTSYLLTKLNDS
jgi:hypothetical protein